MENTTTTTTTTTTNLLADQLLQQKMDAFKQEFAEMISTLSKMMPSSKEPTTNTTTTTTTTPDEPMVKDVLIEKKSEKQIILKDDKETEPKSSSSSSSSVNKVNNIDTDSSADSATKPVYDLKNPMDGADRLAILKENLSETTLSQSLFSAIKNYENSHFNFIHNHESQCIGHDLDLFEKPEIPIKTMIIDLLLLMAKRAEQMEEYLQQK